MKKSIVLGFLFALVVLGINLRSEAAETLSIGKMSSAETTSVPMNKEDAATFRRLTEDIHARRTELQKVNKDDVKTIVRLNEEIVARQTELKSVIKSIFKMNETRCSVSFCDIWAIIDNDTGKTVGWCDECSMKCYR